MVFLLTIAFTAYASAMTKLQAQNAELDAIKSNYEKEINAESLSKLYNELTGTRKWLQGEGTEQNPYKIYKIEDLVEFSNRTNKNTGAESFEGKYIELMNTVDFNNVTTYENAERTDFGDLNGDGQIDTIKTELTTYAGFKPIGSKTAFKGTFKGNNNEIKNLYEDKKTLNILGLFASINNATIQNFGVTGNITNTVSADTNSRIGGIIALTNGVCYIKNCYSNVNITNSFNIANIGGIIGSSSGQVTVENCYNLGDFNGGRNLGGIAGTAAGTLQISDSHNKGNIKTEYSYTSRNSFFRNNRFYSMHKS